MQGCTTGFPGEGVSGCFRQGDDNERRGRVGKSDKDKILVRIEESDMGVILEEGADLIGEQCFLLTETYC